MNSMDEYIRSRGIYLDWPSTQEVEHAVLFDEIKKLKTRVLKLERGKNHARRLSR